MTASKKLLARLREAEEFRAEAYLDQAGFPTIGYGTTCYTQTKRVKLGDKCTREQAEKWFQKDIETAERIVTRRIKLELTQDQFDALVMFAYNTGGLGQSLPQALNAGDIPAAIEAWQQWKWITDRKTGEKKVSRGLINRRNEEIAIFTGGYVSTVMT